MLKRSTFRRILNLVSNILPKLIDFQVVLVIVVLKIHAVDMMSYGFSNQYEVFKLRFFQ